MTRLVRPDLRYYDSWASAVAEYGELGTHGSDLWSVEDLGTTREALAAYLPQLWVGEGPREALPEGRVPVLPAQTVSRTFCPACSVAAPVWVEAHAVGAVASNSILASASISMSRPR